MIEASAPAKVILLGEHAVVYDQPAIAVPVSALRAIVRVDPDMTGSGIIAEDLSAGIMSFLGDGSIVSPLSVLARNLIAELRIEVPEAVLRIRSDIPVASGLGSGAAVAAAFGRAFAMAAGHKIDNQTLNQLVFEVEKIHHGTPSGIDNTVIVYECPIYYRRNQPIETLQVRSPFWLLIADTGKSALTRVSVGDVKRLYEANPDTTGPVIRKIGEVVDAARKSIEIGDLQTLGLLMNENHTLLQQLTVSSVELDRLVETARAAGAWGAKLSGGGRGGNMIALAGENQLETIQQALYDAGAVRVISTLIRTDETL